MNREKILKMAIHLVTKDRQEDYGDANGNLNLAAELIDAYIKHLGRPLEGSDVTVIHMLSKIARTVYGFKDDNAIDIAGYAALYGELKADEIKFEAELNGEFDDDFTGKENANVTVNTEGGSNVVSINKADVQ